MTCFRTWLLPSMTATMYIPASDVGLILGDFNAQLGSDHSSWKGIIGRHSFFSEDGPTDNGLRLLSFSCDHHLAVASSFFQQRRRHKVTWRHLNQASKDTCIDHILISSRHLSSVQRARSHRVHFGHSINGTSHNLVAGSLQLHLRAAPRAGSRSKLHRPDTQQLADEHVRARYAEAVSNRFEVLGDLASLEYSAGCDAFCSAALEVLGKAPKRSKHTGQLSEETQQLLRLKHRMMSQSNISDADLRRIKRQVTGAVKRDAAAFYAAKAQQIEGQVQRNRTRDAFSQVKSLVDVYGGKRANDFAHLENAEGNRVEGAEEKLEACAVYFDKLLNCAKAVQLPEFEQPEAARPPPGASPAPCLRSAALLQHLGARASTSRAM